MVLDDDADILNVLAMVLTSEGCVARESLSPEEALMQLDGVDVVVVDQAMPEMTGTEFIAAARGAGGGGRGGGVAGGGRAAPRARAARAPGGRMSSGLYTRPCASGVTRKVTNATTPAAPEPIKARFDKSSDSDVADFHGASNAKPSAPLLHFAAQFMHMKHSDGIQWPG